MELCLSLGSNLGDRLNNITRAFGNIESLDAVTLSASSSIYETEPVDVQAEYQDKPFLNMVMIIETSIPVHEIFEKLHEIESLMGRCQTGERNIPRNIDIDVIYAGSEFIEDDELIVPHPRWFERRFVVQPLSDVRSGLVVAGRDKTVEEILITLPERPKVVVFKEHI